MSADEDVNNDAYTSLSAPAGAWSPALNFFAWFLSCSMLKSSHPFRSRRCRLASDASSSFSAPLVGSSSPRFFAFFAFFAAFFAASSARASRIDSSSSPLGLSGIRVWSASANSGPSMSSTAARASRSARSLTTKPLGASAKNLVFPLASSPVTGHENFASTANRNEDESVVCFVPEGSSRVGSAFALL